MRLKTAVKLLGLAFMILLVSIGIGIVGGVPVPPPRKREHDTEQVSEQPIREEVDTAEFQKQNQE